MLSSSSSKIATVAARRCAPRTFTPILQARGMASEKQIKQQIVSTKNLKKITSSMKMVSAAKLKGDEARRAIAIPFNSWTTELCGPPVEVTDETTFAEIPQKSLLVPISSDKGLCGGVNSFISRSVKKCATALSAEGKEFDVVVIGDKGRSQLRRAMGESIQKSMTDLTSPGTFSLAAALTAEIVSVTKEAEYDAIVIVYNAYVNPVTYNQMYKVIRPFAPEGEEGEPLQDYEFEAEAKDDILENMYDFMVTSQLFDSLMDAAAAEQSSRMSAMENASKNAGEMIDKLTLQYNRVRQARITTELIEIISGASAIEG